MSDSGKTSEDASPQARHGHSPAEWITLLISSLLIAAVVVAVGYFQFTRGDLPPTFQAELQSAETRTGSDQFYVPVTVTNIGDEPAQDVRVRVELHAGETTETAVFTLEILAPGASEEGVAVFAHDPSQGEVRAVVESFL
ncbi:MAG: hypothetical protein M3Z20_21180 [Chloroflexota bacterium]|nr:hypothetical protein [Chloroflexota bacterium]